jgi:hypothetical protein
MMGILVFLGFDDFEQAGHSCDGYKPTSSCLRKWDYSNRRDWEISGDLTSGAAPVEHLSNDFEKAIDSIGMIGSLGGMNLLDIPGGGGR